MFVVHDVFLVTAVVVRTVRPFVVPVSVFQEAQISGQDLSCFPKGSMYVAIW